MATVHGKHAASSRAGEYYQENGFFDSPIIGTYTLIQSAMYPLDIEEITIVTKSGSCTGSLEIEGTPITGIDTKTWNTIEVTNTATALNSMSVGDKLTMVLSGVTCFGLSWTMKTKRTA